MNECNYPTDVCNRFWSKVIVPKNYKKDCWIWTAGKGNDGYGIFFVETDWPLRAHRFAYQYYKGPISNECIMHSCDNPICMNPYHIHQGTVCENNTDRSVKGRSAIGSRGGNAKLDEATVRQIKTLLKYHNYTNQMIATQFGIGTSNASRIRRNVIWKHVTV